MQQAWWVGVVVGGLAVAPTARAAEPVMHELGLMAAGRFGPEIAVPAIGFTFRHPLGAVAWGAGASFYAWPQTNLYGVGVEVRLYPVPGAPMPYVAAAAEPLVNEWVREGESLGRWGPLGRVGFDLSRGPIAADVSLGAGWSPHGGPTWLLGVGLGANLY